jgi:hypothetical protein
MKLRAATNGIVFGLALIAASRLPAQGWDLAADWSNTTNPNGVWTYQVGGSTGILGTRGSDSFGPPGAPAIWSTGSNYVGWSQSNGSESGNNWDLPVGDIYAHTGPVEIEWTSPISGTISITGGTWMIRDIGRSADWALTFGATTLDSGSLYSGDPFSSGSPDTISALVSVNPGDVIMFSASSSGTPDYIALNLAIATVPEPATGALVAGIFMLGSTLGMHRRQDRKLRHGPGAARASSIL